MSKEPSVFLDWLRQLSAHNINYFLEGGQAVNLWAYRFTSEEPELFSYLPFTSKDCDIWIDADGFKRINDILKAHLKKSSSPLDGQLGIVTSYDNELVLDLLQDVFGLNNNELKQAISRRLEVEGIKVIDPIYLFKGKCHNLVNLPQSGRNDAKHILMLSLIIPTYLKAYLTALNSGESDDPKHLKDEIKLLLSFQKDKHVRQAISEFEITFEQLIPLVDILKVRPLKEETIRHFPLLCVTNRYSKGQTFKRRNYSTLPLTLCYQCIMNIF